MTAEVRSLILMLGVLAGCQGPRPTAAPPAAEAPEPVPVRLNENYRAVDTGGEVEEFVQRFESEEREIYQKREEILAALGLRPGMCVADIGAGTGLFTVAMAQAVAPGGKVYAVDIVPAFLQRIEEQAAAAGAPVETVLCTQKSVELPPGSIDVAFVCDTYHHFEYPQHSLASLRQALRPGGALVLVELRREADTTDAWLLDHVRGTKEEFLGEIQAAGFELVGEEPFLEENYFLRFRRP